MHTCQPIWACFISTASRGFKGHQALASSTTYRSCSTVARRSIRSRNPCSTYAADFSAIYRGACQTKASSIAGDSVGQANLAALRGSSFKTRRLIEDVGRLQDFSDPPPLILKNDHYPCCTEFRQQCRQQAIEQGSLSLLGIGEKEIKAYTRKGILTLTQLAHTFRPRRKGKRVERSNRRYRALQAMALRDKTVFILGSPSLPTSPVKVYFDVEGDPDDGYIYLIGMLVCDGGIGAITRTHSGPTARIRRSSSHSSFWRR